MDSDQFHIFGIHDSKFTIGHKNVKIYENVKLQQIEIISLMNSACVLKTAENFLQVCCQSQHELEM